MTQDADTVAINTVRGPCLDAIQRANSGYQGGPMGAHRDRFVLSAGHVSALL